MRFMVIVKANEQSEAGVMPSDRLLTEMMQFNEELAKAGVLVAGEGLQASSKGARVKFSGNKSIVTDGPFAETKELVAGFWLWQCDSLADAIEWAKRVPNPDGDDGEIEIRPVFEVGTCGGDLPPEVKEREERLRAQLAGQHSTDHTRA